MACEMLRAIAQIALPPEQKSLGALTSGFVHSSRLLPAGRADNAGRGEEWQREAEHSCVVQSLYLSAEHN